MTIILILTAGIAAQVAAMYVPGLEGWAALFAIWTGLAVVFTRLIQRENAERVGHGLPDRKAA